MTRTVVVELPVQLDGVLHPLDERLEVTPRLDFEAQRCLAVNLAEPEKCEVHDRLRALARLHRRQAGGD